jgi:ribosomal protein S12 methylthiotransferase accessory factor
MEFDITFPGGKRVNAQINGWSIATDQAPRSGGEGSAPEPYMLFLASLGTCAGIYVLGFCQSRELPTDGLRITQHLEWEGHKLSKVRFDIHLPEGFPEKYRDAVVRAAEMCAVKRTLEEPPAFETRTLPA